MSTKQLLVLFLILFFLPVVFGKVDFSPFQTFFQQINWENFKTAFVKVFQDDFNFYKNLAAPWIQKLVDLIKSNLPKLPTTTP